MCRGNVVDLDFAVVNVMSHGMITYMDVSWRYLAGLSEISSAA